MTVTNPQRIRRVNAIAALGTRVAYRNKADTFVALNPAEHRDVHVLHLYRVPFVLFVSPFEQDGRRYVARGLHRVAAWHTHVDLRDVVRAAIDQAAWLVDLDVRYRAVEAELQRWRRYPHLAMFSNPKRPQPIALTCDLTLLARLLDSVSEARHQTAHLAWLEKRQQVQP